MQAYRGVTATGKPADVTTFSVPFRSSPADDRHAGCLSATGDAFQALTSTTTTVGGFTGWNQTNTDPVETC